MIFRSASSSCKPHQHIRQLQQNSTAVLG